jgi:hypothetical protein
MCIGHQAERVAMTQPAGGYWRLGLQNNLARDLARLQQFVRVSGLAQWQHLGDLRLDLSILKEGQQCLDILAELFGALLLGRINRARHDTPGAGPKLQEEKAGHRCGKPKHRITFALNSRCSPKEDQRAVLRQRLVRLAGLADFCRRTRLPRRLIEHLVLAGACDGWGQPRRALLWELGTLRYAVEELDLSIPISGMDLPPLGLEEAQELQMRLLGLSTEEHTLARWREALTARGYVWTWPYDRGSCASSLERRRPAEVRPHQHAAARLAITLPAEEPWIVLWECEELVIALNDRTKMLG